MSGILTIDKGSPNWWLSPDIWVLPQGSANTGPPGVTPIAGQPYDVWVRVRNNYPEPTDEGWSVFVEWVIPTAGDIPIVAADILRGLADGAAIGFTAPRDLSLPVQAVTYRPSLGPTRTAERQTRCWRRFVKAMAVFTRAQRELLTLAVLLNTSVHRIAAARGLQAPILMGQLVACLDMLAQHLAAEVDEAMARGLAA